MSSAAIRPASNNKDNTIKKLNSKQTGNGKNEKTVYVVKQTEEKTCTFSSIRRII